MSMSNEEKDRFIKENISKDKYVFSGNDAYNTIISTEIDEVKIKPQRYTHKQKRIVLILFILLVASVLLNTYFLTGNRVRLGAKTFKEIIISPIVIENDIQDKLKDIDDEVKGQEKNKEEENTVAFTQVQKDDLSVNVVIPEKTEEDNQKAEKDSKDYAKEIDEEVLKQELKNYALGIGRFDDIIDSTEENTILLVITANAMESQRYTNKDAKKASNYATTKDNVHKFIEELTSIKLNNPLVSYNNYIGYSQASNAYIWGKDGNPFAGEKYEILTLEFNEKNNSGFKVSGLIEKIANEKRFVYHYNATISSNGSDYSYNKYQIKTFTFKLTEGEDEVFRLIDKVEEVDPKAKKSN